MSVAQLVKQYQEGGGSDDIAGAQLQSKGIKARDELIRMLDDSKTPIDDGGTIIQILFVYFRSEESIKAMERYASRVGDPRLRGVIQQMKMMMRGKGPRGR